MRPATLCQERAPPSPQPPAINSPATRTTSPHRPPGRPVLCPGNIVRPTTRRRRGHVITRNLLPKLWTSRRRGLITIGRFHAFFTERNSCHAVNPWLDLGLLWYFEANSLSDVKWCYPRWHNTQTEYPWMQKYNLKYGEVPLGLAIRNSRWWNVIPHGLRNLWKLPINLQPTLWYKDYRPVFYPRHRYYKFWILPGKELTSRNQLLKEYAIWTEKRKRNLYCGTSTTHQLWANKNILQLWPIAGLRRWY